MTAPLDDSVPPRETMAAQSTGQEFPTQVGRYLLLEKIGGGGMGAVYKARHSALNREVAVKLIHPHRAHDKGFVARFWREMEAAGKLHHPHIVRATDAGQENEVLFLVMDLVDGLDLDRLIQLHHPLDVADVCEMIRQAALGLEAIRREGMVHRDIKPSNLVIDREGTVKILDLGLALLGSEGEREELTPSGMTLGTADYLAPEQAGDSKKVDIRADLYSLGCAMYKLLTSKPPFAAPKFSTWRQKVTAHCMLPLPPLSGRPDVPSELQAVLSKLTAKSPEDRYQTPLELAEALAPFTTGSNTPRLVTEESIASAAVLVGLSLEAETPQSQTRTLAEGKHLSPTPPRGRIPKAALVAVPISILIAWALWAWQPWLALAPVPVKELDRKIVREPVPGSKDFYVGPEGMIEAKRLPALKWMPLLEHPPRPLLWFPGDGLSSYQHNPDLKQLTVNTESYGVFGLAQVNVPAFQLHLPMHMARWTGGVGILLGLRETKDPRYQLEPKGKNWTGQYLLLRTVNDPKLGIRFSLARGRMTMCQDPLGKLNHLDSLVCADIVPTPQSEQVLEIHVAANALTKVRWGNTDLDLLCSPAANRKFEPEDYQGSIAAFNFVASCTYRDARILVAAPVLP